MSHQPERKEKDCLNCGTMVHGRFCQACGQENIVPHQSFGHLVKHFIFDLFHFDGKFFETLRKLIFRPGMVPADYIRGKRMRHLDPIRMYLFTSALFFLVFFTVGDMKTALRVNVGDTILTREDRLEMIREFRDELAAKPGDTGVLRKLSIVQDTSRPLSMDDLYAINDQNFVNLTDSNYSSVAAYDSVQKSLPRKQRDNWFQRIMVRRSIEANNKYKGDWKTGAQELSNVFMHNMPYLLFLSLPFFALILKLLYIRRKNFFYSDHLIFSLYHYIFSFICLLLVCFIYALRDWTNLGFLKFINLLLILTIPVYLHRAMKHFYGQGTVKRTVKFLALLVLGLVVVVFLLAIFFLLSIFQI